MKTFVVLVALCAACTVNRKSQQYTCITTSDCSNGRTCDQGYCVTGPGSGSGMDPACGPQCTSCDHSTTPPTCVIDGNAGAAIACPPNEPCKVACASPGACNTVDCPANAPSCEIACTSAGACSSVTCNAATCTITCSSLDACGSVTCGENGGACNVTCSSTNACSQVTCASACSCDVSCANKPACGMLSCPTSSQGGFCTDTGSAGAACSSSPSGCNHC